VTREFRAVVVGQPPRFQRALSRTNCFRRLASATPRIAAIVPRADRDLLLCDMIHPTEKRVEVGAWRTQPDATSYSNIATVVSLMKISIAIIDSTVLPTPP